MDIIYLVYPGRKITGYPGHKKMVAETQFLDQGFHCQAGGQP